MPEVVARLGGSGRTLAVLGATVAVLGVVLFLALQGSGPRYSPLFTDLDPRDAGDIVNRLEEQKVPYRLENGGRTVLVPEDVLYRTRLTLAQEGLPRSGTVGFEIMDKVSLGATEFDRRVQFLRAVQGELTRTILQIDGVEAARVHLNVPEKSLFVTEEKPASAAVLLRLRRGARLDPSQVRGIANLVASSVEGLRAEDVTVLDEAGRLLTARDDTGLLAGTGGATGALTAQADYEQRLEQAVQSLLDRIFGPGNAVARVRAELDLNRETREEETYEPGVAGEGVLRSIQQLEERFAGGAVPGGGVPGVDSNTGAPVYQTGAAGGAGEFTRTQSSKTFEVNRIRRTVAVAPGAIKRLSVSVVVNRAHRRLSAVDRANVENVVSAALGVRPERGDTVTVMDLPFDTSLADALKGDLAEKGAGTDRRGGLSPLLAAGAAAAGLLLGGLVFFLFRRRVRREKERLARELAELQARAQAEAALAKVSREAEPIQVSPEAAALQGQVATLARQKPEEVAQIIRSWLSEE